LIIIIFTLLCKEKIIWLTNTKGLYKLTITNEQLKTFKSNFIGALNIMKNSILKILSIASIITILTGCARDLSSNTYTSSSTLSLTLEGKVISARAIKIKDNDKMADNKMGMLAGGAMGAVSGSGIGKGTGNDMAIVGTAIAGGIAGAALEGALTTQNGFEYIIKVDTSKLKSEYFEGNAAMRNAISSATTSGVITVVQGSDNPIAVGQTVYVIYSDNRTRVISANK
jgi:outer membrane lipoprotein SlyB